jgi:hypothetical protein
MFKRMPKAFWIGMVLMYGYAGLFMILEWNIPGLPIMKFLGQPAAFVYHLLIAIFALNVFLAWYFAYSEEQREDKLKKK